MIVRRSLILASTVLVLLAGYTVWWRITAHAIASRIDGWIAAEQAKGAMIVPATVSVGGYPAAFSVTLDNPHLAWPGGFGFDGQHVRVLSRPWSIRTVDARATGGFAFTVPPGGARPAYAIAGETVRGKLAFADDPLPTGVAATLDGLSASRAAAEGKNVREMTIATLELTGARPKTRPAADTEVGLDFSLHLIDLSGESIEANPLGGTIADTNVQAKLLGALPASLDTLGLTAWRDAGGTIEVTNLALRWGPLGLSGKGTLALDSQMQPEGAFTARLSGFEKAIDAMTQAGWVKPGAAAVAKLGLGLASRPGQDGKDTAEIPVSIQNRHISVGPARLGEVPELKLD